MQWARTLRRGKWHQRARLHPCPPARATCEVQPLYLYRSRRLCRVGGRGEGPKRVSHQRHLHPRPAAGRRRVIQRSLPLPLKQRRSGGLGVSMRWWCVVVRWHGGAAARCAVMVTASAPGARAFTSATAGNDGGAPLAAVQGAGRPPQLQLWGWARRRHRTAMSCLGHASRT